MSQAFKFSGSGGGNITFPITVPQGGTGQVNLPAHTVLIGNGTDPINTAGPGASNSILMGQGAGSDPVFGTLIAGSNITRTPGATSITISATSSGSGSITFTDDAASTATTNAGAINLFGDSASGSSVLGDGAQTITVSNLSATDSQLGVVELATNAETLTGISTSLVIPPDDLKAKLGSQTLNGVPFGQGQTAALSWTAQGAANTVLLGNGGVPSFGAVPNAALSNSSVTLNSGNNITVTGGGPLSLGGVASFDLSGTTNHAVQVGNASASLTSLALGTNGQVLIGSTGADPQFGTITSSDGSITFTLGAGTLGMKVTAGSTTILTLTADDLIARSPTAGNFNLFGTSAQGLSTSGSGSTITFTNSDATTLQKGVVLLASNAESIAGTNTTKAVTPDDLKAKLGLQTLHGVMIGGATTGALSVTAVGSTGQVLLGQTGADPIWGAVPNSALQNSSITLNNGNNITITGSPVSLGGAATVNVSGTTNHSLLLGNASGSISNLGVATNGQIPIGSTGSDPVLATLTAGTNISITNAAGSITINATGGSSALVASARNISTTAVTTSAFCQKISTTPTTSNTASLISITYSPTSASNILEFDFSCPMGPQSISACDIGVFLFQGSTVIAGHTFSSASGQYLTATFKFYKTAGTTSSTVYTVRWANANAANPIYALCFSGTGTPLYNATGNTSMVFTLKEYTS
jgi:hypothetical protein